MFSNTIKIMLFITCFVFSIVSSQALSALLFFFVGTLLFYECCRYGTMRLLFQYVKEGKTAEAKKLLSLINYLKIISPQQRAYYYFVKGLFEESRKDFEAAKVSYLQALNVGLRTTNDKSMASLNLANAYYRQGKLEQARGRLREAMEIPHKQELDVRMEELKIAIDRDNEA